MKRMLPLAAALLLSLPLLANAQQDVEPHSERDAVRRVVETYLSKSDPVMVRRTLSPNARIISIESGGGRVVETPIATPANRRTRGTVTIPAQRIVDIDVTEDGAMVKVESVFAGNSTPAVTPPRHIQYISLLRINGEWKIVSILMPPLRFIETARN